MENFPTVAAVDTGAANPVNTALAPHQFALTWLASKEKKADKKNCCSKD